MNTLYKVVKGRTESKGFWLDKGKIYRDSIKRVIFSQDELDNAFNSGELAVFVSNGEQAVIIGKDGTRQDLKHCIRIDREHISAQYIRSLINEHGGLTINRNHGIFSIEIWKA